MTAICLQSLEYLVLFVSIKADQKGVCGWYNYRDFCYGPELVHVIWFFGHLLLYKLAQETLPPPWTLGRGPGVGGAGLAGWAGLD